MTIRLWLGMFVGACGLWLLIAADHTTPELVAGLGLVFTALGLVVDHRY